MNFRHVARNTKGRDLLVGDLHGSLTHLRAALDAVAFDPERDRLFCVGDLVDRGPESAAILELLHQPWFMSVIGNHEVAAIAYAGGQIPVAEYAGAFGGQWFIGMTPVERLPYLDAFEDLPFAIELETANGLLGLVHAEVPSGMSWPRLREALSTSTTWDEVNHLQDWLLWSRTRIDTGETSMVAGVKAVFVGHTPVERPTVLGNHVYIDCGAWIGRPPRNPFVLIDAATLLPAVAPGA